MKNILAIFLIMIFCMMFVSCDDFLDINPDSEVVNDDMFSTRRGIEDAIYGVYGSLKENSLYGEYLSWSFTEVLAQNLTAPNAIPYDELSEYNYNDIKSYLNTIWTKSYEVIGHANNIITNLEKYDQSSYELYNIYLGEVYGIRAFLHFDILRLFAPHIEYSPDKQGIPYVTEYSFKHTPFSTVSQVYEKIITDLKKSQQLLLSDKDNVSYPRIDAEATDKEFLKGRELHFNYYAATAVLARVYWMKGDLENARTEALKVIDSGMFPLVQKDEVVNIIAGVLSPKESVWGLFSTDYFETTEKRLYQSKSWESFSPYQAASGGQYKIPYDLIYSKYLGENAGIDSRLQWFRSSVEGNQTVNCLKVVDVFRIKTSGSTPASRGLLEGISMVRIPEMYYIVAEAELKDGNVEEAAKYVNKVLNSRGLTTLGSRIPELVLDEDILYNERHKELFCEGQRWFEMKKKNMDITSNAENKVIPASDDIYVLPIPVEEFEYRND